jgi:DNA-binding NarL/FixJ family response regulator
VRRIITVLVAARDRETLSRCTAALARDRGVRIVGRADDLLVALAVTGRVRPRIVVLASPVRRDTVPLFVRAVAACSRGTRVIVVSTRTSTARVLDAVTNGARGHVALATVPVRLAHAVHVVARGEAWLPRKLEAQVVSRLTALN